MNWQFPMKAKSSAPNMIRDVVGRGMKIPGFISFALGNPAKDAIPADIIVESAREMLNEDPMKILQYGDVLGDAELREMITKHLVEDLNFPAEDQTLVMLAGSGQGLGLSSRCFCQEGDEVYLDEFSFSNMINAVNNVGAVPVGIPMDEEGMIPSELAKAAASGKGKFIYLIPNFHNPLGKTISLERRKELYAVAQEYDLLIYEDDPYGEIRFEGEFLPGFKSMDTDGRVIYAGSYSKILAAGLRVGFLYGRKDIMQIMQLIKTNGEAQNPLLNQIIVRKTLQKLDYEEHLKKIRAIYGVKCKCMLDALRKYMPAGATFTEPQGGMFLWLTIPDSVDSEEYFEAAMSKGVGMVKSKAFATDPEKAGNSFRLNYTFSSDEDIEKGIKILGDILKEMM